MFFFFFRLWGTPRFEPPHRFKSLGDATDYIIEMIGKGAKIEQYAEIIKYEQTDRH